MSDNVLDAFGEDLDDDGSYPTARSNGRLKKSEVQQQLEDGEFKMSAKQFAVAAPGIFTITGKTTKKLPAGLYTLTTDQYGNPIYMEIPINIDELMSFPDNVSAQVIHEVEDFWNAKEKFEMYGFLHRRGYLFFGPAGGGKSSTVQLIVKDIVKREGIAFLAAQPGVLVKCISDYRKVEPDRPVVIIFEDIEAYIQEYGESSLLSFLDGEVQITNVLNIATTNYPEKLDKRIVARPRRFDRLIFVDMPCEETRRIYLKNKLKIEDEELATWVSETKSFSFAALSELVVSVKCLGKPFAEAIKCLKDLQKKKQTSEDFNKTANMGINA